MIQLSAAKLLNIVLITIILMMSLIIVLNSKGFVPVNKTEGFTSVNEVKVSVKSKNSPVVIGIDALFL